MPLFRLKSRAQAAPPTQERVGDVLAEVRRIEVVAGGLITDVLSGGYRSTFRGVGVEFSDVREYVEGDDPRTVDWNVTARVGRPFVKRFVEERERTLVFVLDLSPSMACGLGAWSPRQAASRYCAMLGRMAIDNHDRVGLVAGGAATPRLVLPQAGGGHVLRLLRDCVSSLCGPGASLAELIAVATARVRRRAVVFVLSDFLTPGYEQALALSGRRHDVIAVRLLPRELVDPPRRLMRTVAPESGMEQLCDFADDRFRTAWLARVQRWRVQHDEVLGRARLHGIDVEIPLAADITELARPLLTFLRRRREQVR